MGKFFHEDFLLLTFLEILIVMIFYSWRFFCGWYFLKFCSWNCSIVNICSMVILRLKILVLVIWLGIIGLGSDFKIDANSGLEFEILIYSMSDLTFEMTCQLWSFIWACFLHNWVVFIVFLSLVIALWSWVWFGLFWLIDWVW